MFARAHLREWYGRQVELVGAYLIKQMGSRVITVYYLDRYMHFKASL
jgi:hypothetical protein